MTGDTHSSTHPPLPPTTEDERFSRLRLLRSRKVGIATYYRLMADHGSARDALLALPEIARAAGVSGYAPCPEPVVAAELAAGKRAGARLVHRGDHDYPKRLEVLPDAPPLFWSLGDLSMLSRPSVALIGARNASSLGLRMATKIAEGLTEAGYVVVSGLARGIDAVVHRASIGSTIAVQAGGVDVLYPRENAELAHEIAAGGLRVSEQAMGLQPQARHFPPRNRIIAGLSQGVVIVEAALRSGSLITAEAALAIGRDVLAVPGHPFDARAGGCNALIRDGATLVRSVNDILDALPPPELGTVCGTPRPPVAAAAAAPVEPAGLRGIAALHSRILDRVGHAPVAEDQLIRDLGAPAMAVAPAIVDLEVEGRLIRQPGGMITRAV